MRKPCGLSAITRSSESCAMNYSRSSACGPSRCLRVFTSGRGRWRNTGLAISTDLIELSGCVSNCQGWDLPETRTVELEFQIACARAETPLRAPQKARSPSDDPEKRSLTRPPTIDQSTSGFRSEEFLA